jgi:cob(I)alamin adenosyltransferase
MKIKGLIQIYTGDGKGKTTAALGLALRAIGWGLKICMIQFIKGGTQVGEIKITKSHIPQFSIHQFKSDKKFIIGKPTKKQKESIAKSFNLAKNIIKKGKYDIVILDEINNCLSQKLLDWREVAKVLKEKPKYIEIILTGRNCPKEIIKIADLVTEMKKIKHPYDKGIHARRGIEF